MPYIVFALKWRPKNFDEIIGQNHIVSTLKNAIQKNRLSHAYLFAGPRGVGKTTTARILAKALNCKQGPTPAPCGECPSCKEITRGTSLDVMEIDGASNRGIDEIRTLREHVKFAPVQGKYKIYIIDEVHQITADGFNALLKTLEEPPEFVKFIFATTHPHKVIPTILSRCQRLDFRRISVKETIVQLERIATAEKIPLDKEVLFTIAKASDGSLRDAESILDQLVSFSQEKISAQDVVSVLGIIEQEALFRITDKIIAKDALGVLELLNTIIDEGKDTGMFLNGLIEHYRNLMVASVSPANSQLIDLPQESCDRLLAQSRAFTMEEIFSAFNILVKTQEMTKRLESARIPLEISLVRLAHDKKSSGKDSVPAGEPAQVEPLPPKQKPSGQRPGIAPAVPPANVDRQRPQKENDAMKDVPPAFSLSLEEVKSIWGSIIDTLGKTKMYLATYLNEGALVGLENNVLTVAFPQNCSLHKETLEERGNKAWIEKVASESCKGALQFNFILSREQQEKNHNPALKSVLETFNGRVIKEE